MKELYKVARDGHGRFTKKGYMKKDKEPSIQHMIKYIVAFMSMQTIEHMGKIRRLSIAMWLLVLYLIFFTYAFWSFSADIIKYLGSL